MTILDNILPTSQIVSDLGSEFAGSPGQVQQTAVTGGGVKVMLSPAPGDSTLNWSPVTLAINPTKVTIGRQAKVEGAKGVVPSDYENAVKATGRLTIKLTDVWLLGSPYVADTLNTLFSLCTPWPEGLGTKLTQSTTSPGTLAYAAYALVSAGAPGSAAASAGGTVVSNTLKGSTSSSAAPAAVLPKVQLSWGSGLTYIVCVNKIDAEITKMSMAGNPIQARIGSLDLYEVPTPLPGQNPTSGGPGGQSTHTVIAGDNIVRIAVNRYGDPKAWRAIATANGVDNTLRLQAGRSLFLPGRTDVAALEAARRSGAEPTP
jgi:nucleoid-associated protein YgaU